MWTPTIKSSIHMLGYINVPGRIISSSLGHFEPHGWLRSRPLMTSMRLYIHFGELHGQFMMESTLQCHIWCNIEAQRTCSDHCANMCKTITTAPELDPSVPKCTALCSPLSCGPSFDRFLFGVLWNDVALKSVATESKANHMVALTNSKSYI